MGQLLTDRVVDAVGDPIVAALLLGKSAEAAERGIDLAIEGELADGDLPPRDLVTVLGNLLDNAFDAVTGHDERRVVVRLTTDAGTTTVSVGDSGDGLTAPDAAQALERGWTTKATGATGRGVGLALVNQVARRHGGEVRIGTSELGGAELTVTLPMSVRVLVVEDEQLTAEAHAAYVERTPGFELAGVARSAGDAARFLNANEVDLVLLDLHLPDGHGLALVQKLRAAGHLVDVIAVTSARDADVVRHAVAQGVVLYLLKPFTYATFRGKLEQYAAYRARLHDGPAEFAQDEVDQVLGSLRAGGSPLPKGMSQETLRDVTKALRDAGTRACRRPRSRRWSAPPGSRCAATSSTWPRSAPSTGARATAGAADQKWSTAGAVATSLRPWIQQLRLDRGGGLSMHDRTALGPADVSDAELTSMVAACWVTTRRVTVLDSLAEQVDYDLPAITTARPLWVRGRARTPAGVAPFELFVKHVQSWSRSPFFEEVPEEIARDGRGQRAVAHRAPPLPDPTSRSTSRRASPCRALSGSSTSTRRRRRSGSR